MINFNFVDVTDEGKDPYSTTIYELNLNNEIKRRSRILKEFTNEEIEEIIKKI